MSKHNQMIGRRGEKLFSLLCSEADVTCNKSSEDDFGWDMAIEFPPRPQPAIALDMQRGPVAALVQVKATEGADRSVAINLANALRYASSPLPTFIVLVMLGEDRPRFFVKHVWASLIGAWLQVARVADAEGRVDTHLQRVSITFDDKDEQTGELLPWIELQISNVRAPYAATKTHIFDTIGFGKSRGTANVTFTLGGANDLLDLQLGLKPHIDANRFVYRSERFGISAGQPEVDLRDVRIILAPEGQAALLRATFPSGASVAVAAKLYAAEDGDVRAWRAVTECLDVVYGPHGRVRAKASLEADVVTHIEELALFAHLQATASGAKVFVEVEVGGQLLDLGFIEMQGQDQSSGWPWMGLSIAVVRNAVSVAGKPMPPSSLASLNSAAWQLEIMCALASERLMRLDFNPERGIPQKFAAMLAYSWAEIGDTMVGVVARRALIKDERLNGGRRRIGFGTARILHSFVANASEWAPEPIERAYRRQLEIMAAEGNILALGDLQVIASQGPGDQPLKCDLPTGLDRPVGSRKRKAR
ncbi:hypothetical protein ACVWZA_004037 [Sphingomonas sp. UYAg733]